MSDHIPSDVYSKCIGKINPYLATGEAHVFLADQFPRLRGALDLSLVDKALENQSVAFRGDARPDLNGLSCEYAGNILKILDHMGIPVYTKDKGYGAVVSGSCGIPTSPDKTVLVHSLTPEGDDFRVPIAKDFDIFLVAKNAELMRMLISQIHVACGSSPIDPVCVKCNRRDRKCLYTTKGYVCPDQDCRDSFTREHNYDVYGYFKHSPVSLKASSSLIWFSFDDIKLEFVVCRAYGSPLDVIKSFDLSQCQWVYYYSATGDPVCEATFGAVFSLEHGLQIVDPGSASNCIETRIVKYIPRFPTLVIPCVEMLPLPPLAITRGLSCVMKLYNGVSWKDLCKALKHSFDVNKDVIVRSHAWLYMPPTSSNLGSSYCPVLAGRTPEEGMYYLKISPFHQIAFKLCDGTTAQFGSPFDRSFSSGPTELYPALWSVSMVENATNSSVSPPLPVVDEASSSDDASPSSQVTPEKPEDTDAWVRTNDDGGMSGRETRYLAKQLKNAVEELQACTIFGEGSFLKVRPDPIDFRFIHVWFEIPVGGDQRVSVIVTLSGYKSISSVPVIRVRTKNPIWESINVCMGDDSHFHTSENTGNNHLAPLIVKIALRFTETAWPDVANSIGFSNIRSVPPLDKVNWLEETRRYNHKHLKGTLSLFEEYAS